jgi:4-hydroxybenzoate polyprenyltransferase
MLSYLKSMLLCIRYQEAFIFQTPTLMGIVVFLPGISAANMAVTLLAGSGSFLVMASIFAMNDWADINLDSQNSIKSKDTFLERGMDPEHVLALAGALAVGGLIIFSVLSWLHVVTALIALLFGLAYSVPIGGVRGKSVPVFSSILHFGGTLLSFLLGALTFTHVDLPSLLIASYPAVLITAGHLVQEVEDYEEDRFSGCQTNAVRFGRKPVFLIASFLFGFSFLLLYWLAEKGFFINIIKYAPILYLLYVSLAMKAYRAGLVRDSVRQLRNHYRILFAVVTLAMMIGSLLKRWTL